MVEEVIFNLIAGEHHSVFFFLELPGVKALAAADFAADQKYFCHAFYITLCRSSSRCKGSLRRCRRLHHIVEAVVVKGGEVQLFADLPHHLPVLLAVRVGVFFKCGTVGVAASSSLMTRRVMSSISDVEREKFKYLQPKSSGGQAGRMCTSFAPLA